MLCEKIAEKIKGTAMGVYRKAIREVGIWRDFHNFGPATANTFRHAWEMLGIGWMTEQVDFEPDGDHVCIRAYYGSSTYNTQQMTRLIEHLVGDAKDLGIQTETPEEINNMLSLWETQKQ